MPSALLARPIPVPSRISDDAHPGWLHLLYKWWSGGEDPARAPGVLLPKLSLVIPCYNEAANLPLLVDRCAVVLADAPDLEVVLVDNGSTDASSVLLPELLEPHDRIRSVRVDDNRGYGHGILAGLAAAEGEFLAWTHADMQTDPADAVRGLALLGGDPACFVKGRRFGRPAADVFFTVGMSLFETALLQTRLWDINAQPTMFHRSFYEGWVDPPTDFSLDLYAYHRAHEQGLTIERMPVYFGPRAHGESRWNIGWTSRLRFIRRTVEFSLQLRRRGGR